MKKRPTSGKAKSSTSWHRHLDRKEQRRANRGTRQVLSRQDKAEQASAAEIDAAAREAENRVQFSEEQP